MSVTNYFGGRRFDHCDTAKLLRMDNKRFEKT
jgi:hypothetical protein